MSREHGLLAMLDNGLPAVIGNTPLVRLHHLFPKGKFELFAKLESFNPTGSIKDRPALGMLRGALARGEIDGETTVIESSSGNLGIAEDWIQYRTTAYQLDLVLHESRSEVRPCHDSLRAVVNHQDGRGRVLGFKPEVYQRSTHGSQHNSKRPGYLPPRAHRGQQQRWREPVLG